MESPKRHKTPPTMPLYNVIPSVHGSLFLLNADAQKRRGYYHSNRFRNVVVLDLPAAPALHSMHQHAVAYQLSAEHLVPALMCVPAFPAPNLTVSQSRPLVTMSTTHVACDTPSSQSEGVAHGVPAQ